MMTMTRVVDVDFGMGGINVKIKDLLELPFDPATRIGVKENNQPILSCLLSELNPDGRVACLSIENLLPANILVIDEDIPADNETWDEFYERAYTPGIMVYIPTRRCCECEYGAHVYGKAYQCSKSQRVFNGKTHPLNCPYLTELRQEGNKHV